MPRVKRKIVTRCYRLWRPRPRSVGVLDRVRGCRDLLAPRRAERAAQVGGAHACLVGGRLLPCGAAGGAAWAAGGAGRAWCGGHGVVSLSLGGGRRALRSVFIVTRGRRGVKREIVTRCYKPRVGFPWAGDAAAADIAPRARGARTGKGDALPWVAGGGRGGGRRRAGGARRFTWNAPVAQAWRSDVSREAEQWRMTFHMKPFHVEPWRWRSDVSHETPNSCRPCRGEMTP